MRHLVLALPVFLLPSLALAQAATPPATAAAPPVVTFDLVLSTADQQQWASVRPAMDACVAGALLRADAGACQQVAAFLAAFADRVAKATPVNPPAK